MNLWFAFLLSVQTGAPGPENLTYLRCLMDSAGAFLARKPSKTEYVRHLDSVCLEQRFQLRHKFFRRQLAQGRSKAEAQRSADKFFETVKIQMLDLAP
jgi:hypothetical protein